MNALFTTLALLAMTGAVATAVILLGARRSPGLARARLRIARVALPLAAAVATVGTAGSLYYSEVAGFTPCALCWYQRLAMYPLVGVLGAAGVWGGAVLRRVGLALAAIGAGISTYHWAIELNPSLRVRDVCSASVPCTAPWVWELGFVSIAFMALSGFLLIAALLVGSARKPEPSPRTSAPTRPRRDLRTVGALGVGVAAVSLAGLVLPNPGAPAAPEPAALQATAPVEVRGEPLPDFTSPAEDDAVGRHAPQVAGETFAGNPIEIAFEGTPTALLFVAHWCPHCQAEVPAVQAWLDANGPPEGVEIQTVSTGVNPSAPNYPPAAWLEREGWTPPVLVDDSESTVGRAYGLTGYPYWVFVDGKGSVVSRASGSLPVEELEATLDALQS